MFLMRLINIIALTQFHLNTHSFELKHLKYTNNKNKRGRYMSPSLDTITSHHFIHECCQCKCTLHTFVKNTQTQRETLKKKRVSVNFFKCAIDFYVTTKKRKIKEMVTKRNFL